MTLNTSVTSLRKRLSVARLSIALLSVALLRLPSVPGVSVHAVTDKQIDSLVGDVKDNHSEADERMFDIFGAGS